MASIADETSTIFANRVAAKERRRAWRPFITLLLLALAIRGGVLWARFDDLRSDPDGYLEIANAVSGTKLYGRKYVVSRNPIRRLPLDATAYRPPLYPYVLVAIASERALTPLHIAVLHLVLGVATVLLTFHIAQAWRLGRGAAFIAALFVAIDPILLRQSTLVMTETIATFVAMLALVALTRFTRRPEPFEAALVGVALGVGSLCRPTFFVWGALVLVVVPLLHAPWIRRITNFAACLAMIAIVIAPWAYRNQVDMGWPIVSTTHGGYTLALGNNPQFYDHLRRSGGSEVWDAEASDLQRAISRARAKANMSAHWEMERDRAAYDVAAESIANDPAMFAVSCVYRLWRFWSPLAMQLTSDESIVVRLLRYLVAVWYVFVFAAGAIGAWVLRKQLWKTPWLWGVLLCVSFTLVHAFYWSDMRMRAPLMPIVAMLAAAGLASLRRNKSARNLPLQP